MVCESSSYVAKSYVCEPSKLVMLFAHLLLWFSMEISSHNGGNWLPGSIKTNLDLDLTETSRTSVFDQEIYTDKLKNQIKVFASDGILRINIFT